MSARNPEIDWVQRVSWGRHRRGSRPSQQITYLLTEWREGDAQAGERLFEIIYPELRRIAERFMARERADHTLIPARSSTSCTCDSWGQISHTTTACTSLRLRLGP